MAERRYTVYLETMTNLVAQTKMPFVFNDTADFIEFVVLTGSLQQTFEDCNAYVSIQRPNNTTDIFSVYNDTEKLTWELPATATNQIGEYLAEITILKNGVKWTSFNFKYSVQETLNDVSTITADDRYTILDQLIQDVSNIDVTMDEINTNEAERKANELLRIANENQRILNENQRITNENARKTAETSRVNAETARQTHFDQMVSVNGELTNNITNGTALNTTLGTTINTANNADINLKATITNANNKNTELNTTIANAEQAKTDLEETIGNANLDNYVTKTFLQTELDSLTATDIKNSDGSTLQNTTDKINSVQNTLENGVVNTPTLSYGMNSVIKNTSKVAQIPETRFDGRHHINIYGKDGNCDNSNIFISNTGATVSIDTSNKVINIGSAKVVGNTSTLPEYYVGTARVYPTLTNKYYCLSGYIKVESGNAWIRTIGFDSADVKTFDITTSPPTTSTSFTRVIKKFSTVSHADSKLTLRLHVSQGGTSYFDGVMLIEITEAEYNDPTYQPPPYVDSYVCLVNPYVEIRHDNLVINGNTEEGISYWVSQGVVTTTVENNKFKVVGTAVGGAYQRIKIKKNTNYYLYGIKSGPMSNIFITNSNMSLRLKDGVGSFNSGEYEEVILFISNDYGAGTSYFDSIMLVEGTTAPTSYKPCRIERCVIEGNFADEDFVILKNGRAEGLINWKHKTLYGKDYDWKYNTQVAGFKQILLQNLQSWNLTNQTDSSDIVQYKIKYDGSILKPYSTTPTGDEAWTENATIPSFYMINIKNSDSGWVDGIAPNNDEVKAYMNGWKAVRNDGTRYVVWVSVLDNSFPPLAITTATGTNASGQNKINVVDGTNIKTGNAIVLKDDAGNIQFYAITAVSGNQITVNVNLESTISTNNPILFNDETSPSTRPMLNYCKNNIAPNYEGYKIHYKLQNPEPITDVNTKVIGDIPKLDVGDNYVNIDSGMVLGEVTNPSYYLSTKDYEINIYGHHSAVNNILKNKVEKIEYIMRNKVIDNLWSKLSDAYAYGKERAYINEVNFDKNAIYTVDYKILTTIAPQIGTTSIKFNSDVVSSINSVANAVESRQKQDSALDGVIDLSMYEEMNLPANIYVPWCLFTNGTKLGLQFLFKFSTRKKTIPMITFNSLALLALGFEYAPKFILEYINATRDYVDIRFTTMDITTINAIKTNGCLGRIKIIVDCRGRV